MNLNEESPGSDSRHGDVKIEHRGRWVIWLLMISLIFFCGILFLPMMLTGLMLGGPGATQMAASQYTPRDVVGDLGGMPVTIPRHMAEFVEYEGDPGWGEKRKGAVPIRTHQSKLTSFGVQFRYPDMATLSSPEMWKDKKSKNIYVKDWMNFGVTTGKRYSGDGFLDRQTNYELRDGVAIDYVYVKQPRRVHGLEAYLLEHKDPSHPKGDLPTLQGSLFIAKNARGRVIANIQCSTVKHAAAPCKHDFSMEFHGVKAEISVGYRRGMLENWKDIQKKVTAMMLGFRVDAAEFSTPLS